MKIINISIAVYSFEELNQEAQNKVMHRYGTTSLDGFYFDKYGDVKLIEKKENKNAIDNNKNKS